MSWFREERDSKTWLQLLFARILKTGSIPHHVAFIMDGNRRYAKAKNIDRIQGHVSGFEKLTEILDWCRELGINEVTVYAFSIENFKRTEEEVQGLMNLATEKFRRLLKEKDLIKKHGVCIRILGNISLLPPELQQLVAEIMLFSKDHDRAFLNVCMAYTSHEEICDAVNTLAGAVADGILKPSDISEELVGKCLYTHNSKDPDLLIRTSGEVRLSDFLLWQSAYSILSFTKVLWPNFTVWNLFAGILYYQAGYKHVKKALDLHAEEVDELQLQSDTECIASELQKHDLPHYISADDIVIEKQEREDRIKVFLQQLEKKRLDYLQTLCCRKMYSS